MKGVLIGFFIAVVLLCIGVVAVYFLQPQWFGLSPRGPGETYVWRTPEVQVPPTAPFGLSANPVSYREVALTWVDNADNEDGFRIYRDGILIATVAANASAYRDINLGYATTYSYSISAYNESGESPRTVAATTRTLNPPITITLDKVGVYDDGESWLRGRAGEQYLYLIVVDGNMKQELRIPAQGHFHLDDNEVVPVRLPIFSTPEVGDYLRLFVIGWEDDGGGFEQLIYEAIGVVAIEALTGGATMGIEGLFAGALGELIGSFFHAQDDHLGTFEQIWYANDSWGIGRHIDVSRDNLRLWFTITGP